MAYSRLRLITIFGSKIAGYKTAYSLSVLNLNAIAVPRNLANLLYRVFYAHDVKIFHWGKEKYKQLCLMKCKGYG